MIQFNIQRFKSLWQWTWTREKRWFVKTTLTYMATFTLLFLFFTCMVVHYEDGKISYFPCAATVMATVIAIFILGGSFMFATMKDKHDDQRYMMLPASNIEKYLMRYSIWILALPCYILSFVVADAVQFLLNTLLRHEGTMWVIQYLMNYTHHLSWMFDETPSYLLILDVVWLHSVFVVGATFFRSHKYNWILTALVLTVGFIVLVTFLPTRYIQVHTSPSLLKGAAYILLIAFNFWLSFRLFCRQQVIGKFMNL